MDILFVHQNFPGQFKHLVPAMVRNGHRVKALAIDGHDVPGVECVRYKPSRGSSATVHPWGVDFETKLIRGESAAAAAERLRDQGYRPDIIVGHPGWGEMLFLKDVWSEVPQLHFLEFFYAAGGTDVGFDPEFTSNDWRATARVRAKNANGLLNLEAMTAGYSPTVWQRQSYPFFAQDRIDVIHDGIDTDALTPDGGASLTVGDGSFTLRPGMQVVTFINRNLEPYRGYHSFMRALPEMQRRCPDALFVLIGGDGVSYGAKAPEGTSWKNIFLNEVREHIDLSRVAFVGNVAYPVFKALMQITAAHVYLTYPFVLSWSLLEAMACGAPIIGSATPPVQEVILNGRNGLLVDFFDYSEIAAQVANVVNHPTRYLDMRAAGRQTVVEKYDLTRICLPRQIGLIEKVARGV
ncbi:glycosyltransferase family 4 protein [Niveispirillum cyanobacteriorum]|uniref:Glycosyl transferase family 1 n=1 Tax=Niveispirillum cyanobacteriorum TaxID=1612173 RepID=A0A2K9NJ13_9PROT|nr:glycosyltransferase family 4 protein [Niveispirillum cyanobacteriorum]AUN33078.1 glycosyl transferase family 1 [Niveispirillum cyanobacteriorum]GGE45564.1 glycosyl transferase [Niveispirillum cyanobacteriorum]